jgi:hypothetical protein
LLLDAEVTRKRRESTELEGAYCPRLLVEEVRHLLR